jgi:uncharacterized protein (DUF1778 family)
MATKVKHPRPGARVRPDTTLERVIPLRVADDDLELIRQAAAADGMPASTWIRAVALGTAAMPAPERHKVTSTAGAAT